MSSSRHNFTIEQGTTLMKPFIWKDSDGVPVDLTGYTAKMQVRQSPQSGTVLLELSTTNGRITLGGASGTITLALIASTTAAINWRRGVYDIELTSGDGTVTRLIEGEIQVSKEVTR